MLLACSPPLTISALVSILEPSERRRLKLFAWFLFLINVCVLGVGVLFGRALEFPRETWLMVGGVALLINFAFLLIVGGNLLFVAISHWLHGPRDSPPD